MRKTMVPVMLALLTVTAHSQTGKQPQEQVYDLGPGITPPKVTHQAEPEYRPDFKGFRISGAVLIGLVVSSRGEPADIHVIRSLQKEVDESAIEAVKKWAFEPARKDGKPVAVRVTVEIRFHDI